MQHRNGGHIGDVLATALEQRAIGHLNIEQHRIEPFAAQTPQGVGHADDRHDLRRRHVAQQRPHQPGQIAGLLPEQQEPQRLLIARRRACTRGRLRRSGRGLLIGLYLLHGFSPSMARGAAIQRSVLSTIGIIASRQK